MTENVKAPTVATVRDLRGSDLATSEILLTNTQTPAANQVGSRLPTAAEVREALDYDPATGEFVWKIRASRNVWPGDRSGSVDAKGYRRIEIGGSCFLAHRIAWLLAYGDWPTGELDHINGDPADNRITNLRTRAQNQANR